MFIVTVDEKNRTLFERMAPEEIFDPLKKEGHFILGAIGEDEQGMYAAGVLVFDVVDDYDGEMRILIGMLRWLYVAEEFRNRGAADALMEEYFRLLAYSGIELAVCDLPFDVQYDELCIYLEGWGFSFYLMDRFELRLTIREMQEIPQLWGKPSKKVVPLSKLGKEELKQVIRKAEALEYIDPDFRDKMRGCDKRISAVIYAGETIKGLSVICPNTDQKLEIAFFRMFEKDASGLKHLIYYSTEQIMKKYGQDVQLWGLCRDEITARIIRKMFPDVQPLLVHRGVCITLDEEE